MSGTRRRQQHRAKNREAEERTSTADRRSLQGARPARHLDDFFGRTVRARRWAYHPDVTRSQTPQGQPRSLPASDHYVGRFGGNRAEIIDSIRNTGYGRFRCIRSARARAPGPRAVAASDAAAVVTCAARRGALSSSTSPDSENPPSVLGSVKFSQILVA